MKLRVFRILVCLLLIAVYSGIKAQKPQNLFFALTSETYAFPMTRFAPIHPGLEIGTTLVERSGNHIDHNINAFVGVYHHRLVENGFYLRGEYAFTYKIKNTLGISIPLGGGYQHSFYPGELYEQDPQTGQWSKKTQFGKPHALVEFGLGLTYLKPKRIQPFVRYESVIDFPLYNSFLTTRAFLKLGVNLHLNNTKND